MHTKVGPGGLSRSPEAILGTGTLSFPSPPTGYICGSNDKPEPENSDWTQNQCNEAQSGDGQDYRGCQTRTQSGKICQNWHSQEPHAHGYTPEAYPDAGLNWNYCRNPGGSQSGVWCYTIDPETPEGVSWASRTTWELCDPLPAATGASGSSVSAYASTCDGNPYCMGFSIDTGNSNTPTWFMTATTSPRGDDSARYHLCRKASDTFATFRGFGKCDCNDNHEGVSCEHKKCPVVNTHVCSDSQKHKCDQKTGRCICAIGYWGDDCSMGGGEDSLVDLP